MFLHFREITFQSEHILLYLDDSQQVVGWYWWFCSWTMKLIRSVCLVYLEHVQRGGFSRPLSTIIVFVGVESGVALFVGLMSCFLATTHLANTHYFIPHFLILLYPRICVNYQNVVVVFSLSLSCEKCSLIRTQWIMILFTFVHPSETWKISRREPKAAE